MATCKPQIKQVGSHLGSSPSNKDRNDLRLAVVWRASGQIAAWLDFASRSHQTEVRIRHLIA